MAYKPFRLLFVLALAFCQTAPTFARKPETGFLDRTVTVDGASYKY